MSVAVTTLRSTIATALANPSVWQVFSFPPATPIANSVIVSWDDPMLEVENNQYNSVGPQANFKITMVTQLFDNQAGLADIEEIIVGVFNKLSACALSIKVGSITAPTVMGIDTGQMLSSEMSISVLTTWS